ncbi:voltage-dependent calcium channel subunit alpha-2/delta-2-like isoform X3 [Ostrea edulis]|uniref:voltage-dependent calcium channel subunit alpha-2/delta-2-like isoform X3 n=1 Tax=Ostrea edulis TaxID=37623 RepID=UPI0024AF45DB|nr:voltage-dependent calcium channel subunit alpha-2/delta-2-like isoform X3 [Ostrea edulis]
MATMSAYPTHRMFLLVFLLLPVFSAGVNMPDKTHVKTWVEQLSRSIEDFEKNLPFTTIGKTFDNKTEGVEKVDGMALIQEMAEKVAQMLENKTEALKRAVTVAESAAANHNFTKDITESNLVNYYKSKDPSYNDLSSILTPNEKFRQSVNTTVSSVHIPVEIYEKDPDILNALMWSHELDKVFTENYEDDKEILWQYFGSQTGFMRSFPASLWKMTDDVDLYDVRRRPWYTQGSSSPKDMLILIDTSGSVVGQSLQLMIVAVKSILDTLGENDFVQIVKFSNKAETVGCMQGFVQANYRNKKYLSSVVDNLEANNMANISKGLEYAFNQFDAFENSTEAGVGAHCNKMIMLLTDGGTDNGDEVFKRRNFNRPLQDRVRVFTYAVGQNPNPTKDIAWMACANRGRFSEIPAMGAIRARVQDYLSHLVSDRLEITSGDDYLLYRIFTDPREYVPVLSRPAALQDIKELKWGNIYNDSLGLGMVVTVTLPVYNRAPSGSNQTILGVMGIDVTTEQMKHFSPAWKLGPSGYTFAINTNGYVIFHPRLKIHNEIEDTPNLDFLDIESENDKKEQLRQDMIDGKSKEEEITTFVSSQDGNHVLEETRKYFYTPIGNTSFSLGLALPRYQNYVMKLTDFTEAKAKEMINLLREQDTAKLLAPWKYYKSSSVTQNQNSSVVVEDLIAALENNYSQTPDNFNTEEMRQLYVDMKVSKSTFSMVKDLMALKMYRPSSDGNDTGTTNTTAVFLATYGGLTTVYPKHEAVVMESYRDPWQSAYFRRALHYDQNFMFHAPYTLGPLDNETTPTVMVTHAVIGSKLQSTPSAVVGMVVTHDFLVEHMNEISATSGSSSVNSCKDVDSAVCFLVDDGAFVVAANHPDYKQQIGRFLGHVDAGLMSQLYGDVYLRVEEVDYQATCINWGNQTSAASLGFRIPSVNLLFEILTFNWWNSIWTWTMVNLNVYSWFSSPPTVTAFTNEPKEYICSKKKAQYYFNPNFKEDTNGIIYPCDENCTRDYVARRVPKSNLLFVVISSTCPDCYESANSKNLIQEPVEMQIADQDVCNQTARYRRNPAKCYDFDDRETNPGCGGPISTPVSVLLVVIATVLTLALARLS